MYFNIPTYEEALSIVNDYNESLFYESKTNVDGYEISMFNYRLANYTDFIDKKSTELRGLTFIFNKDGSLYKRYIMLHKFWNINQVSETMYNDIKNHKILSVMNKEDGSLISFNKLPNGRIIARSKMSFISYQAKKSNKLYEDNINIKRLVDWSLSNGIVLFFEYVDYHNKVVLDYHKEDLILIRARYENGDYLDIRDINTDGVSVAEFYNITLDDIIESSKYLENKEGWVIQTEKMFLKHKTDWYRNRHHLFTKRLNRPDEVIKLILDSEIDDVLSQLSNSEIDKLKRDYITNIEIKISKYISISSMNIDELLSNYNGDRKEFAIKYKNNEWFNIAIKTIENKDSKFYHIKNKILKDTNSLKKSENWLSLIE